MTNIQSSVKIDLIKFEKYLVDRKWTKQESPNKNINIFNNKKESQNYQIILPEKKELLDYNQRIEKAIINLANFENRSYESVYQDLILPVSDIIRISIKNTDTSDGTISFDDGFELLANTRKALIASACSVKSPKGFHARQYGLDISEYINSCRLGQSEVGSYVIKIICPVENGFQTRLDGEIVEEFGRKTVANLMKSIKFMAENISRDQIKKIYAPEDGDIIVSSNLCDALIDLKPNTDNFKVNFDVTWAHDIKKPDVESHASYDNSHIEGILLVSKKLKPISEEIEEEFVGYVKELRGDYQEKRMQGTTILKLLQENGRPLNVRVKLSPEDYKIATTCHGNHSSIKIKGKVVKESIRTYILRDYTAFSKIERS